MKLRFIKSPTGSPLNLAYNIGDEAEIKDGELAKSLIENGFAEPAKKAEGKKETAASKQKKETRAKKK